VFSEISGVALTEIPERERPSSFIVRPEAEEDLKRLFSGMTRTGQV
jgi:hypothetical protein